MGELDGAVRDVRLPGHLHLVLQQIVLEDEGGEVAYAIRVDGGRVSVVPGRAPDADVTFTQDRATAEAIAQGTLSAQMAFMAGRLRVGGNLHEVLGRAGDLIDVGDLFATTRTATTW
jgi:putative sterol carrier protein